MSTILPTPTLSHLLHTVILVCLLYLLGLVIARGLARLTARVTQQGSEITRIRKDDVDV